MNHYYDSVEKLKTELELSIDYVQGMIAGGFTAVPYDFDSILYAFNNLPSQYKYRVMKKKSLPFDFYEENTLAEALAEVMEKPNLEFEDLEIIQKSFTAVMNDDNLETKDDIINGLIVSLEAANPDVLGKGIQDAQKREEFFKVTLKEGLEKIVTETPIGTKKSKIDPEEHTAYILQQIHKGL